MPDSVSPSIRIHRVTTRRRNLRELQCPLEAELLVAEFAGELPPEVALAVREHVAVCEICGGRSQALQEPYKLLSSLGHEPVPYVPDLRDSVRVQAHQQRFYWGLVRAMGNLGRGSAIGLVGLLAIVLIAALILGGTFFPVSARQVSRSTNSLQHVSAAGSAGTLLAETDKLVTISGANGQQWQVAEVIAVSEQSGSVTHSLPTSDGSLQNAQQSQLPVATVLAPGGKTVFEVTAPNARFQQALVAFDATTGTVSYAVMLNLPAGHSADSLVLSPDGKTAYIGVNNPTPANGGTRILAMDASNGSLLNSFAPGVTTTIPMPPPPGSLPVSVFPSVAPKLHVGTLKVGLGAGGDLAVSPDGRWLFDVLTLSNGQGQQYAVVRRIDAQSGKTQQELALQGNFTLARLGADGNKNVQQVYLMKGSPDAQCFVLDAGKSGPLLLGAIPLGGPPVPAHSTFTGNLSMSPTADGSQLYVTQYAATGNGAITGHDFWLLDTQNMGIIAHNVDNEAADAALVNSAGGAHAPIFVLQGGQIELFKNDLSGTPTPWLNLGDGHSVVHLLGTAK